MKRRGSAMVFVVILTAAMTGVMLTLVTVTSSTLAGTKRAEEQLRRRLAVDGAVDLVLGEQDKAGLILPTTKNATLSSVVASATASSYHATIPHTIKVDVTTTYKGVASTETRYVGQRGIPSPFCYALFVDNSITLSQVLNTGSSGANGDIYANGTVNLTGTGGAVNGEIEATGSISPGSTTVSGNLFPGSSAITYPTINQVDYTLAGTVTLSSSLNGYTFGAESGGYYPLLVRVGDLSIRGTIRGKGTIFVTGNVTVSAAMTYGDSSSRLFIIAQGNVTYSSTATTAVGSVYCNNLVVGAPGLTVSRGGFVCKGLNVSGPMAITCDPAIWTTESEGDKHRLPGFWP